VERGELLLAGINVFGSVIAGLLAVFAGLVLGRAI